MDVKHSKTFSRKGDAERWLRTEEARIDRAEWVDRRAARSCSRSNYAETWLKGLHELKPKTLHEYRWHLTAMVLPAFGDKRPRSIRPALIREWQSQLLADGLSAGTVRQSRQVLSSILGQAVDVRDVGSQPGR